jgi:hypothetical protein
LIRRLKRAYAQVLLLYLEVDLRSRADLFFMTGDAPGAHVV